MQATVQLGESGIETAQPGIYETWLQTTLGKVDVARYPLNVEPRESEMDLASDLDMQETLGSVVTRWLAWDELQTQVSKSQRSSLTRILLATLAFVLLLEQWLGFKNSYHA